MPREQNCAAISAKLAPIKISFTQEKKKVRLCMCGHLCKPKGIRLQKHTFGREERARLQCSPVIISASPGVRSQSQQLCLQGLWALGECVSRTQHSSEVNTKPTAHHKTSNLHKTHTLPHVYLVRGCL